MMTCCIFVYSVIKLDLNQAIRVSHINNIFNKKGADLNWLVRRSTILSLPLK